MAITLNPNEIRVLGVLIEKSMTTPQYYPMTLNAVTIACNQKNNRDPITALTEGEVGAALHELQRWQLVSQPGPEPGSRANKFRHDVEKKLGWTPAQRAILCELFIRGPQTLNALLTNTARMKQFESAQTLREVLAELERAAPPLVLELSRRTGQRETRFAQLLGGSVEEPVASQPVPSVTAAEALPTHASLSGSQPPPQARSIDLLAGRVETLEHRIVVLEAEIESLRDSLRAAGPR